MEDLELEDNVVEVEDVAEDESTDDYLNEILTESQYMDDDNDEFDKNSEGVTGDEWKEEERKRLEEQIKEERKQENKRNAERRIKEKQQREQAADDKGKDEPKQETRLEDGDLDKAELEQIRERTEYLEQQMSIAAPVMDYLVQNKMGKQEIELGVDFVNHWRTDKVGCVKKLLTALEKEGIDVGQILTHDDAQLRVMQGVNQQMQPIMQQREQEMRMTESKNLLDGFLAKYPDAWNHLEEITGVMQKTGVRNPYDAYFRLRRAYTQNNQSWFGEERIVEEVEGELPTVPSPRANAYGKYQPQEFGSIDEIVEAKAREFFGS